ncbi:hypothetical protein [Photorhabdus bodei]|uniref:hypothetical protein n=1 Tax=Photorhabdus bodei TaxID=2029681 RepID=UPI001E51ADEB|nr:hypothetical protein [Photorhabdus bodei]
MLCYPKYSGWSSADWRRPNLHERQIPEQTLLELPTVSLIPENILMQLKLKFGAKFEQLENLDRMILATVAVEGWINHQRACELTTLHSREVTLAFPRLEHKGFLVSSGEKRNKSYTLPGMSLPDPEELFSTGAVNNINNMDLPHKEPSLPHIVSGTQTHRDTLGRLTPLSFSLPFIDSLEYISLDLRKKLEEIAKPAYENRRLEPEEMQLIIMKLCQSHYIRIDVLSILLNRSAKNLRQRHIKPLLDNGISANTKSSQSRIYCQDSIAGLIPYYQGFGKDEKI